MVFCNHSWQYWQEEVLVKKVARAAPGSESCCLNGLPLAAALPLIFIGFTGSRGKLELPLATELPG